MDLSFKGDILGGLAVVLPPLDRHLQVLRHLRLGFGVWGFGFWVLGFRRWILDFEFRVSDFGFWILSFGFRISLFCFVLSVFLCLCVCFLGFYFRFCVFRVLCVMFLVSDVWFGFGGYPEKLEVADVLCHVRRLPRQRVSKTLPLPLGLP